MSEENVEAFRTTMAGSARGRRRIEERFAMSFPGIFRFLARAVWRLPNSRLRRALAYRTVRVGWEAFNRKDYDVVFAPYHPECQSIFPAEMTTVGLEPGTYDLEERIQFQRRIGAEWQELRFEPSELITVGDRVITIGRMNFKGLSSGIPVDTDWIVILTILEGQVVREEYFLDRNEALEAVGLSE